MNIIFLLLLIIYTTQHLCEVKQESTSNIITIHIDYLMSDIKFGRFFNDTCYCNSFYGFAKFIYNT